MRPIRSFLAVAVLCAASGVAGIVGYNLVQNVEFARAAQEVQATRQQLNHAEDLSTVFREVAKVVSPSVVRIQVTKKIEGFHSENPFENDPMFRRFFEHNFPGFGDNNDNGNDDNNDNGSYEEVGIGSGVIMEVDGDHGYIVTNNHVAGGAQQMTVTLADGRTITSKAKVLGTDPSTDLAVVEITAKHLIPAKWGDSNELQQGDWVLAFGSPFGYVGSMTHGIVSALHRTGVGIIQVHNTEGYENFIQTDAPINPGNSGGPLVNVHGEVIGINTAIASRDGGFQGIGFAIPSDMVKNVYTQIKEKGKVTRGWLGVGIKSVSADLKLAQSFGYDKTTGVLVEQVLPGTPAADKLKNGDIITSVNGQKVKNAEELREQIATTAPGQDVKFGIFRDGHEQNITVKLGEQPGNLAMSALTGEGASNSSNAGGGESANLDNLGIRLNDLTDQQAQQLGLKNVKGAVVTHVNQNSPAGQAGLMPGDVITRVGNTPVTNAAEAQKALSNAKLSQGIRLYVTHRGGSQEFLFLQSTGE